MVLFIPVLVVSLPWPAESGWELVYLHAGQKSRFVLAVVSSTHDGISRVIGFPAKSDLR